MRLDRTILRSRVALRIFGLFVASALLPVLILVLLSYGMLESQQERVARNRLRDAAKDYALTLFERLDLAQGDLEVLRTGEGSAQAVPHLFEGLLRRRFRALLRLDDDGAVRWRVGEPFSAPPRLDRLNRVVGDNPSVLVSLAGEAGLLIVRRLGGGRGTGWVLALVDPGFLWGREDERDQGLSLCVQDASAHLLFCPDAGLRRRVAEGAGRTLPGGRLVETWSLFVGARFQATHWRVLAAARSPSTLEPLGLQSILLKVSLLTLLVATLLSVYLIRKTFMPLEALMAGIRSLSHNDFSEPVRVDGGDELGTIAEAFNHMAGRIQRQLHRFSALSAIDNAILARLERSEMVGAILRGTAFSVACDRVVIAIGETPEGRFEVYEMAGPGGYGIRHRPVRLAPEGLEHLSQGPVQPGEGDYPELLEPLRRDGVRCFLLLPVRLEGRLAALFLCGYRVQCPPPESRSEVTEFADRLAVGLADAQRQERLNYLAYHDALTDLPNRLLLMDRLTQALAQAQREGSGVAVLYVDLDRFKSVNDSLGHEVGDDLLREMTHRLRHSVRGGDTLARLGGDEFVVVAANLHPEAGAGGAALAVAEQILAAVAVAGCYQGHEIRLSASIGIALAPGDGTDPDSLLKNADAAMYHAKREGRNNCQFYSAELNSRALARLDLAAELHRALEAEELRVFFQPKLHLDSRRVVGVEALLRWLHPRRGLLLPDEFVDLAEETGLIIEVGHWMLRNACDQVAAWQRAGSTGLCLSVNVSPRQFARADLVDRVREVLAASGLPAASLELEITEGTVIQNPERTLAMLHTLRGMGVRTSIDDFGMGYSSLAYLKRFPLDVLKIDKSFVQNMQDDATDFAIVKSVVVLAHSLGLEVVAEGVETREQMQLLHALGCDLVQGFLCSPPVGEARFKRLLERGACAGLADDAP